MIYLDYAATAPVPLPVARTVCQVLTEEFGNPSSRYEAGQRARRRLEEDRAAVAAAMGCPPQRLFFTSCGTEGDNWAIRAALWQNRHVGRHIVTSAVEHSAVLETCRALEQEGYSLTYLTPDREGNLYPEQVAAALREDTALVSLMLVNNETGCLFPIRETAALLAGRKTLLHCDAVQGFLELPDPVCSLGADLVTVSGHKIGAPKGIGALYMGPRLPAPRPLLFGGGQEGGLRSGTEPTAQIAGFAQAARLRMERLPENLAHLRACRDYARQLLAEIPELTFLGRGGAPHILSFSLPGYPSQNVVNDLGSQGICLSAGSACHKGKPSHVFAALGLPKRVTAGALRVSFGPETTPAEIEALASALKRHRESRFPML